MRSLSDLFKWVGYAVLAIAIVVGIYMAVQAESFLVCLYYVVGGGVACMLLLAYGYILDVAADLKDKIFTQNERPKFPADFKLDRHDEYGPVKSVVKAPGAEYVICPECKVEQRNDRPNCLHCGAKLPNSL